MKHTSKYVHLRRSPSGDVPLSKRRDGLHPGAGEGASCHYQGHLGRASGLGPPAGLGPGRRLARLGDIKGRRRRESLGRPDAKHELERTATTRARARRRGDRAPSRARGAARPCATSSAARGARTSSARRRALALKWGKAAAVAYPALTFLAVCSIGPEGVT